MLATTLASLALAVLLAVTSLAWQIRGRLDSINHRLDRLEDLAGIERAR